MAKRNPFKYSEKQRNKIIKEQDKQIKSVYRDGYNNVREYFKSISNRNPQSEYIQKIYLKDIKREMSEIMTVIDRSTERIVNTNVDKMVKVVLENNQQYLTGLGYKDMINTRGMRNKAVESILNGSIYKNQSWNLSSAIWGDNKTRIKEINKIIAKGMMENKNVNQIAKDLQKYVNPSMRNAIKIPGVRGKIDYNALRLARTTIQHAYQKAFVDSTILNPFIDAYRWVTAGTGNVCGLCIERETDDKFGLGAGIFPKDQLPLDHPNGQCTFDVVVTMTDEEIADAIADWYLGEGDETMNRKIDEFVKSLK